MMKRHLTLALALLPLLGASALAQDAAARRRESRPIQSSTSS